MTDNYEKKLTLHIGYPKAGSSSIVYNISKIAKNCNVININEEQELLNVFEMIRLSNDIKFNENFQLIKNKLNKYLIKKTNFFCYERAFNISDKISNKFNFIRRCKKITKALNVNFKITVFIRHQASMITSYYKEEFFKIIFINFRFIRFKYFVNYVLNSENNFANNLNYFSNLSELKTILRNENIYISTLENFAQNQGDELKKILKFSEIVQYDLGKRIKSPLNSSKNRDLKKLLLQRLYSYIKLEKKIHSNTLKNFLIIVLRIIFFDQILNSYVKLNKVDHKKIDNFFKSSNDCCKTLLNEVNFLKIQERK